MFFADGSKRRCISRLDGAPRAIRTPTYRFRSHLFS